MTEHRYTIEVQSDFLERQAKARPVQAVAELIWNGLDADAMRVTVRLEYGELGMTKIVVRDNGLGIPYDDAPKLFQRLGGSWKKPGGVTTGRGRMLHGYEGRGRFKVFALGRVADWSVTYRKEDGSLSGYGITMLEDNIREVRITDEAVVEAGEPGVEIEITELHRDFRSLAPDDAIQELAEIFALYLKDYRDVSILYEGQHVDPNSVIAATHVVDLNQIVDEDISYSATLEIIEWRSVTTRGLYLCTEQGFPLTKVTTRFHIGEFHFSAYLKSPFITKLHGEAQLDLAEMNPLLNACIEEAQQVIKVYFRDRAAERARTVVEEWKAENVYPYKGEAETPLQDAERKVFDILAVTASDYMPDFQNAPPKRKAYDLRMLKTAIEKSPEDLQLIMNEVLGLPKRKQEELAGLLREASLSSIISAAKIVADRLKFLSGLEQILFDKDKKERLKERSQLHKIIEDNTWLFGEEYNLSVSDKGLTAVLRAHAKVLGADIIVDTPVKHISQKKGIVDLMLSRVLRRHRADEVEHLVVELKRPSVKIGDAEVTQVEKYAISVAKDERFRTVNGVQWTFWAISDDIDEYASYRMDDRGVVSEKGNITVGIKTWGQVIAENKARLQFFQEKLEHQVDDDVALKHLQDKYQEFLSGVVTEEPLEKRDAEDEIDGSSEQGKPGS
ncbi:MAG: ATP-binding protein [Nitrospira sp.]|nr:ATP-binding protein [Nitrospira sp.]